VRFRVQLEGRLWKCICGCWRFDLCFDPCGEGTGFNLSGVLPDSERRKLRMWIPQEERISASTAAPPAHDGAIFIVHGSDTLRAGRVARTVKEATGRQTIILREQASLGRTLIEKFEQHAAVASYAIVVLTPDDEGGRKDQGEHRPRGAPERDLRNGLLLRRPRPQPGMRAGPPRR
jgi:hypothetical protein